MERPLTSSERPSESAPNQEYITHPRKRGRTACTRCKTRKQKCDHEYPICSNCRKAGADCDKVSLSREGDYSSGYINALEERIAFLEGKHSRSNGSRTVYGPVRPSSASSLVHSGTPFSQPSPGNNPRTGTEPSTLGEIVGLLSSGALETPTYVGSSSGLSLAVNLGEMVRATVMTKAVPDSSGCIPGAATNYSSQNEANKVDDSSDVRFRTIKLDELLKNRADPPNDDMGARIVNAYLSRVHSRYPFLDRTELWTLHEDRWLMARMKADDLSQSQRFDIFKLYMVYAIAATMMQLSEKYTYTPPEKFYITAIQHVAAACETRSIQNIEAMTLLVLYHLRSATSHGLWYMIGLAMRTCIDLGLHRKANTAHLDPFTTQLRRRLFWSVYYLERAISLSLGRPFSINDRQIDIDLPLDVDDDIRDPAILTSLQPPTAVTTISLGIVLLKLRRIDSKIQHSIYRADRPLQTLRPKMDKLYRELEEWKASVMPHFANDLDYTTLHFNRAVRLLIQPFLPLIPVTDPYYQICIRAAGEICQAHKKLHQTLEYGHSFLAVQTVFVAGITLLYALWTNGEQVWSVRMSNDIRACSTVLFVMTERAAWVKRYRDAFELLVNAAMEKLQGNEAAATSGMAGMMAAQGYTNQINNNQNGSRPDPVPPTVAPSVSEGATAPDPFQFRFQFDIDEDAMRMAMELAPWIDQDLGEGAGSPLWMPDFDTLQNLAGPYQY